MNASTVAALNRLNRGFYDRHGLSFSATRSRPWPGWQRAVRPFLDVRSRSGERSGARAIVDVGCGNGRFGVFVDTLQCGPVDYLGIDNSREMIRLARQRLAPRASVEASFRLHGLTDEPVLSATDGSFDLAVLFGVLHHVPGLQSRRRLLRDVAARVVPKGLLIVSFWQFGARERFRRRQIPWSLHNAHCDDPIDERQLETGDFLLAWGEGPAEDEGAASDPGPRRYCHYASPDESAEMVGDLGLATIDQFESDGDSGDLNLYFVLRREE